jgi:hypothetical protein
LALSVRTFFGGFVAAFSRRPLAHQLAALVLVTALPLVGATILMFDRLVANERQATRQSLMVSAQTLADLVDNEIDTHAAIAHTLSILPSLQKADLEGFRSEAKRAIEFVPGAWLALSTPDGQIVLNTLALPGMDLPKHPALDIIQKGIVTGRPQVGNLILGLVAKRLTAFVEVPVFKEGAPIYSISIALAPARFLGLIEGSFSHGEVVGILDQNFRFVARVPDHEQRLGTLASEGWRGAIARSSEGWIENTTLEAQIDAPLRSILWSTIATALVLAALSAGVASLSPDESAEA